MTDGAHGAIDSKISQNNLNPKNIKNQVNSETLDMYGLFEDYMFNQGTAIFNAQTQGGDNRFYNRGFSMPSTYGLDDNEPYSTKDQIMQLLSNSIRESPDDTVSTQSVQDLYKLHKQPMPKYKKGGLTGLFAAFGGGDKESGEKNEALMALNKILSSGDKFQGYSGKTPSHRSAFKDIKMTDEGRYSGREIMQIDTPEGKRYYPGQGQSQDLQLAIDKASFDALSRMQSSPSDSITTDQYKLLKESGLY